jgi:Myb/SANT-like DNA-binding domain
MADVKKRPRAVNFLPSEHTLLVKLVDKYKNIVENKKTDAVSNDKKTSGWVKLTEEFNVLSGTYPRTLNNLKSKFDNIKRSTKKIITAERNERFKTGGGVPYIPTPNPEVEKIREIMGVGLDGMFNCRDSNGMRSLQLEAG